MRPHAQAKIAEGTWLLALDTPTLPPASATNTLIFGGDRLLIVEPASPHPREQARLDALLDARIAEGRVLAGLVITHHHVDHIGYAEGLRRRFELPIFAHAQTAARVEFAVDHEIDAGWTLELGGGHVAHALYTPGHAPGHLVIEDQRSGIAHAGDLVAGVGTILIDPSDGGDMSQYLASLERMAARSRDRPDAVVIPAHGPVQARPAELFEAYIRHRLAREDKVRRAVLKGEQRSFEAILAAAYDDAPKHVWPLAALSLEAHLRRLVEQGELVREGLGARSP